MGNIRSIIEEYGKADFGKRLYLFLEHPSLRSDFMEIDQHETAGPSFKKSDKRCLWAKIGTFFQVSLK